MDPIAGVEIRQPTGCHQVQLHIAGHRGRKGLKEFVPPRGPFDPQWSWTHSYRIWQIEAAPPDIIGGELKIRRATQPEGVLLEVQQQSLMRLLKDKRYGYCVKALIRSAADQWSTPRQFTAETWTNQQGEEEAGSRLKFAARAAGAEIRFSGLKKPAVRLTPPWTLDWALFDVLQRLPAGAPHEFVLDVVEDGDLLRPRQRLTYAGSLTTKLGGKASELYGFCRVGTGALPTLCDYAHTAPPPDMRGRSLRPVLEAAHSPWRQYVVAHNWVVGRMVRSQRYKYIAYKGDATDQLFDLVKDP